MATRDTDYMLSTGPFLTATLDDGIGIVAGLFVDPSQLDVSHEVAEVVLQN